MLGEIFTLEDADAVASGAVFSQGEFIGISYDTATTPEGYPLADLAISVDSALGFVDIPNEQIASINFSPATPSTPGPIASTPEPATTLALLAAGGGLWLQRKQRNA